MPIATFAYDAKTCRQIAGIKNLSNVEFVKVDIGLDSSVEQLEKQYKLSKAAIVESADLYDINNLNHERCLLLPKKDGILKAIEKPWRFGELMISYGITREQFKKYNTISDRALKTVDQKAIVFIPIITADKMTRKYLFPVYGGHVVRRFNDITVDPIRTVKTVQNDIKILGKTYNLEVRAIADGKVISLGYEDEKNNAVIIQHANGLKSYIFFARNKTFVNVGQQVKKGDLLAHYSSDRHQHTLRLRIEKNNQPIDPMKLFAQ